MLKDSLEEKEYIKYMSKRCPINAIKFVNRNSESGRDNKFTHIEFNGEFDLAFSRSASSRPLTSFSVGE